MIRSPDDRSRPTFAARIAARALGLHRCQGGQAIYVVVVFLFLVAGLLFLVINTGEQLNHKVEMQGAADSVTATSAAWYARGLNVISTSNVTETHLLSLIVLCDALESVTPPATECIDDLMKNLSQAKAKKDIPLDDRLSSWLVVGNGASEQEIIHRFDDIVKAVNWPELLTYDSGVLWECTKLMDGFSHAMAKDTPVVAVRESIEIAKKNHADFGFCLPLWPELPVEEGTFLDFQEPMRSAHMPLRYRNAVINGFGRIMGYYGYNGQPLGPWGYWREPFTSTRPMGLFDISRFSVLFNIVSQMKFDMMFGSTDDQASLRRWEMDYDRAKGLSPADIRRAWWEQVSFDARYPQATDSSKPWQREDAGLAAKKPYPPPPAGSWDIKKYESRPTPGTRTYGDMRNPNLSGWTRATQSYDGADPREAVWYRVDQRRSAHYPQIGIIAPHAPTKPDGSSWPYLASEMKTYYHVSLMRFNGAELETDTPLHRNYLPPAGGPPNLAPIFFTAEGDNLTDNIVQHFTFNGFAYRSGKATNWPQRFINPNPIENLVCYAEARVYMSNRGSWDLFTQYWKVKLVKTDRWKDLLPELDKSVPGNSTAASELTPERKKPVRDMLGAYNWEFVKEVTH